MLKKLPGKGFRNDTVDSQILTIDNSMRTIESKNSIKTWYPYVLNQRTKFMYTNKPIAKLCISLS